MPLKMDAAAAKRADNFNSVIRESGKYVGVITRAERLLSRNNVEGVGLSFKSDDGASANYLDVYTVKPDGEKLRGHSVITALLCCLQLREAADGDITFERWDSEAGRLVNTTAPGYPALMGKRIGLVLQKELQTHSQTGADVERVSIMAVFDPVTNLMASEILDRKTKAERLEAVTKILAANPVRDTRKRRAAPVAVAATLAGGSAPATQELDNFDDVPF